MNNTMIKLVKPSMEYAEDIMKYRQEFMDAGDSLDGCSDLKKYSSAKEWIQNLEMIENENTCPKDKVCSDTYLSIRINDNKVVGMINFRHHINHPILSVWGGHIGYSVRPSERKQGYAKEMLKQNLKICKDYGLKEVLITCDFDNVGSERTILANGGKFEKEVLVEGDRMKRYWVQL